MPAMPRLLSIDLMRGLVIVLMALDHSRDFFSNMLFDPTDLSRTNTALFLTRWITHLCAPTFVFLAGVSAYLSVIRHDLSREQLCWMLLTRGAWLIVLELTLVHFGWTFNWDFHFLLLQVIWALGWSMIILAGLSFLPRPLILLFALILIGAHNLFDGLKPSALQTWGWLWSLLHVPGKIEFLPGWFFYVSYPLIPWVGVMAAGYCFGPVFLQPEKIRKNFLLRLGLVCIVVFFALRLPNVYGDPHPWTAQKSAMFTFFAVLNVKKYPPSLLFLLVTFGMMFIGLWLFEIKRLQRLGRPLLIFGRVPIFFYILHLLIIHGAMLTITWYRGLPADWLFRSPFPRLPVAEYGFDLPTVYGFWFLVLLLLYPLCRAYGLLRQQHPDSRWLSYL